MKLSEWFKEMQININIVLNNMILAQDKECEARWHAQQQKFQAEKQEKLKRLCRKSWCMCLKEARWEGGAIRWGGRRRMFMTFRSTGGKELEIREHGSTALCYHVQRAVRLPRQSEERTTSAHLGPPQEQPSASAGKLRTAAQLHETMLKIYESVFSQRYRSPWIIVF